MHKVGRAIQRINNPVVFIRSLCSRALLGDKSCLWQRKSQSLHNHLLSFHINIGNKIVQSLFLYFGVVKSCTFMPDKLTSAPGYFYNFIENMLQIYFHSVLISKLIIVNNLMTITQ